MVILFGVAGSIVGLWLGGMLMQAAGSSPTGSGLSGTIGILIVGPFAVGGFFLGAYLYSQLAERLGDG